MVGFLHEAKLIRTTREQKKREITSYGEVKSQLDGTKIGGIGQGDFAFLTIPQNLVKTLSSTWFLEWWYKW